MILRIMQGGFQTSKIKTIGLVLDFFNPRILEGAHSYLEQYGIMLDARWSVRGDWTPNKTGWDGVIYGIVDNLDLRKRIQKWNMPRVSLIPEDDEDWLVTPDFVQCGVMAARELVDSGATSLLNAVITSRAIDIQFFQGVSMFAREHSIPCKEIEMTFSSMRKLNDKLIKEIECHSKPMGLCQPHAGVAYSLQPTLIDLGIGIPEEVSMVVIDKDIQLTPSLATVALTTIELNEWHRGFVAAEMVHHLLIDKPLTESRILIPPKEVKRRASTGHEVVKDQVVAKALDYVRKNFREPIDVAKVVSKVGVSRRVVEMRFRETLNRGIHEELTRLRIEEAKRLIADKMINITSVAEACGFSSVHYFSTAFKREIGMSPKQYQKQQG